MKRTALKRGTSVLKKTPLKKRKTKINKESKRFLPMHRRTLQTAVNAWIRERDGRCMVFASHCYKPEYGPCSGMLNASHIFAEGSYQSLRYDPANIIAKCVAHHKTWWHQKTAESQVWIREHMGPAHEELRLRAINFFHPWTDAREMLLLKRTLKDNPDSYEEVYEKVINKLIDWDMVR